MSRRDRRRGTWWPAALLAALAMVSGAACSGSDPESVQVPLAAESSASVAETDGSSSVGDGPSAAESPDPEGVDPDGADPGGGDADGGGSGEDPEWFTPHAERVYPLSAFIVELQTELFPGSQRFDSDPMAVREQMTLECMTEQGFRYEMVDWAVIDAEIDAALGSVSTDEIMATGGYGLADSLDASQVMESSYVDPNEAIKASLSAEELEAWQRQYLVCVHEAQDAHFEPMVIHQALSEDTKALRERIDADPRVTEAHAEWSACMAQHGHDYTNQEEIFEHLSPIADSLLARLRALGGPDHIDAEFQADLDAFRALEADIAVADVACSDRVEQVIREVRFEHEQRFLDENQARMAALLREGSPTITAPASFEEVQRLVQRLWVCAPTRSEPGPQCMPSLLAGLESLRW